MSRPGTDAAGQAGVADPAGVLAAARARLVQAAQRLCDLRGCPLADGIAALHADYVSGSLDVRLAADIGTFRTANAAARQLVRPVGLVPLASLAHWLTTGDLLNGAAPAGIRMASAERKPAFDALMAHIDAQASAAGVTGGKAVAHVVQAAAQSSEAEPNEARRLLMAALGSGGRKAGDSALPSIWTVQAWYRSHSARRVQVAPRAVNRQVKGWTPRSERWQATARAVVRAHPRVAVGQQYLMLLNGWKSWWGKPVSRAVFVQFAEQVARER